MAITNKTGATTGPDGIINAVPTNGVGSVQATNFHSYFADLLNWIFPGASTNKGAVLTASATDYSLTWNVLVPVGTIAMFATSNSNANPDGWLFCNGSQVAIANYPDLYNLIGNNYNEGQTPNPGFFFLPRIGQSGETWIFNDNDTYSDETPSFSVSDSIAESSIHVMIKY